MYRLVCNNVKLGCFINKVFTNNNNNNNNNNNKNNKYDLYLSRNIL